MLTFQYNDGGRAAAGYRGRVRDCATRAIAIATGSCYEDIYRALHRKRLRKPLRCAGLTRAPGCANIPSRGTSDASAGGSLMARAPRTGS